MTAASRARLRRFLTKRDYRGADMDIARRVTAAAALLTALVVSALSPIAPPDVPLASTGWGIFAAVVGAYAVLGVRLKRAAELKPDAALAAHYAGLAGIAVLVWLSDGRESPYTTLFLIWIAVAGAVHPPRRTLALIAASAVLASLPLFYDDWSNVFAGDLLLRFVIWSALALMACVWTSGVRMQRADLMQEEEQAKRQARVDALTGLGNRRAFDERIDRAIERARAQALPLSVIVLDLDGFKQINDSYGHVSGDELLRAAAAVMRAAVRDRDACFRWGGDEFAVVLPRVRQNAAERVAERLAASVVASCTRPDGEPQTVAWGSAELEPQMHATDLLASADLALMTRKHERQRGSRSSAGPPP